LSCGKWSFYAGYDAASQGGSAIPSRRHDVDHGLGPDVVDVVMAYLNYAPRSNRTRRSP
jgi:hypothetical protein